MTNVYQGGFELMLGRKLDMSDDRRKIGAAMIRESLAKSEGLPKEERVEKVRKVTRDFLEAEGYASAIHDMEEAFKEVKSDMPTKFAIHPFVTTIAQESFPDLLGEK